MMRSRRYGPRDIYERPGAIYSDVLRYYQPSGRSVIARVVSARKRVAELRAELAERRAWLREPGSLQSERAYNALVIRALLRAEQYLEEYIELEAAGAEERMRDALARRVPC